MIEIKKFVFGPFSENTYLVFDTSTRESMVIDPGNLDPSEDDIIDSFIIEKNLNLKYIIVTHCHIDHLMGVKYLLDNYSPKFLTSEEDIPLLKNVELQSSLFGLEINVPPEPDEFISESKVIEIGSSSAMFIFTPGHTPGEYCLYFPKEKILLSGDVLFRDGIGRTDLWGGDYKTLLNSIADKILVLPDDVKIFPGHNGETTIGTEKKSNPFLTKQSF